MVDWPEPLTISNAVRVLKKAFTESYTEGAEESEEKERDLNYMVAVSSGKAVTEDIPKQIGRRAGWASQQGANFVEILIENPSQLVMDQEMLVNLADQLDLHYNVHSSTSLAYGMSYRVGRGNGYDSAHEYTVKLLKAIRRFRDDLEERGMMQDANGHPRLYAVNGHMAQAQFPPEEEQFATDVSVGPYGEPIEQSDIFESEKAREQIWKSYLVDLLRQERRLFQIVLDELGLTGVFVDLQREKLLEKLIDRGYLPEQGEEQNIVGQRYESMDRNEIARYAGQDLSPRTEDADWEYPPVEQSELRRLRNEAEDEAEDEAYEDARDEVVEDRDQFEKVTQIRSIEREMHKESHVFRRIIPYWMAHAEEDQIVEMWENITDITTKDVDELDGAVKEGLDQPRKEEDIIAAATGAYVWGHFTQVPPGYENDGTLLRLLEEADVYWSFEAHMAGPAENARIWKPKDMVEVVKAINTTPVEVTDEQGNETERAVDRARITIDMEHIATQKVDPMWVVDPPEDVAEKEGYKGLDEGDGRYIMINHVTHPYIGEQKHHHGPVRRGDTLVYDYIHTLVDKGMCTDPDHPTVVMYEIGGEKDETIFMLRLMLNMIEHGIEPDELKGDGAAQIINKDQPDGLHEYLIQKFFGVTDTEVQHEWQEIFEHSLDPLEDLLESTSGGHTWMGRAATDRGVRPEEWQGEEYQ